MKKHNYYHVTVYCNGVYVTRLNGNRLTGGIDFRGKPLVALWAGQNLITTFGGSPLFRKETLRVCSVYNNGDSTTSNIEWDIEAEF